MRRRGAVRSPQSEGVVRRSVVAGLGIAVLLALLIGAILALRDEPPVPTDYDDEIAAEFVDTCATEATDLGFASPERFCSCSYERIAATISFERFAEVDAAIREDPGAVPDEIRRIRTECFAETASVVPSTDAP